MNINPFLSHEEPRLVFFTGAGLSKESGLNTFRCKGGLWENVKVEDVCDISTFKQNYTKVHDFYNSLRIKLGEVSPNSAHNFIAEIQKQYGTRVLHFTANVDDLNEKAGGTCIHLHGNLLEVLDNYTPDGEYIEVKRLGYEAFTPTPGVAAKPNIVFFGESTRYEDGERVYIYDDMQTVLAALRPQDICVVIGSGDTVLEWSWYCGKLSFATTLNVNPNKQKWDERFQDNVYKPCTEAIPYMIDFITKHMN